MSRKKCPPIAISMAKTKKLIESMWTSFPTLNMAKIKEIKLGNGKILTLSADTPFKQEEGNITITALPFKRKIKKG
jgi:hypothetical protein